MVLSAVLTTPDGGARDLHRIPAPTLPRQHPGMTMAQALARFPMGASMTPLGGLTIKRRSRPCNALTGCPAWVSVRPPVP